MYCEIHIFELWLKECIKKAWKKFRLEQGRGFVSRSSLNFFQAFFWQLHKLRVYMSVMIIHSN